MNNVRETINTMLVKTFHEILELEEKAIITDEFSDISNNDMHIIEAIGLGEGARMSVVAKRLNITVGSLTTSMNSLVNKGYVARSRSEKDRRVVNVYLYIIENTWDTAPVACRSFTARAAGTSSVFF